MPAVACRVPATTYSALVTRVRIPAFSESPAKAGRMYYVYVLQSLRDRKFYIGLTNAVERRYLQHETGLHRSTWKRRPLRLIFYEAFLDKQDAERRERYFKTSKGKTTLKQMIRNFLDSQQVV